MVIRRAKASIDRIRFAIDLLSSSILVCLDKRQGTSLESLPMALRIEEPRFRWFAATTIRNAGETGNKSGAGLEDAGATLWSVVCARGGRRTGTRTDRQSLRLPSTIVLRPRWSRITVRRQSANNVETVRRARFPCPAGQIACRLVGGVVRRLPILPTRSRMRRRTPW